MWRKKTLSAPPVRDETTDDPKAPTGVSTGSNDPVVLAGNAVVLSRSPA